MRLPSNSETANQLVAQRFRLCNSAESAIRNALGEQLHLSLAEAKAFLHDACQLTNATSFLAEHIFRSRSANDDLGTRRGNADLNARIAVLRQFSNQEIVQLRKEDAIRNKLEERTEFGTERG